MFKIEQTPEIVTAYKDLKHTRTIAPHCLLPSPYRAEWNAIRPRSPRVAFSLERPRRRERRKYRTPMNLPATSLTLCSQCTMQKENTHLQKKRNQHQKQLRRHLWQVCEMELHSVHLDVSMDACWIRKQEKTRQIDTYQHQERNGEAAHGYRNQ